MSTRTLIALLTVVSGAGCGWRANMASLSALGKQAHVVCYSGGKVIYDGWSDGRIENEPQSDGYYFEDVDDHRLKSVSGQCIIDYGAPRK